jgi:hypothetical protein
MEIQKQDPVLPVKDVIQPPIPEPINSLPINDPPNQVVSFALNEDQKDLYKHKLFSMRNIVIVILIWIGFHFLLVLLNLPRLSQTNLEKVLNSANIKYERVDSSYYHNCISTAIGFIGAGYSCYANYSIYYKSSGNLDSDCRELNKSFGYVMPDAIICDSTSSVKKGSAYYSCEFKGTDMPDTISIQNYKDNIADKFFVCVASDQVKIL